MMALFIVLWLLNSSKQIQVAVGGYFKDPSGSSKKVGSNMQGTGENFVLTRDNMPKLKEQLQLAMKQMADFERLKSHIEMTVTAEGLRIELSESASGTFLIPAAPNSNQMAPNFSSLWHKSSGSSPTRFRSRATPTRNPMLLRRPTETGSSRPTGPTLLGASCKLTASARTKSGKFAASPTRGFASPKPRWIPRTGASR